VVRRIQERPHEEGEEEGRMVGGIGQVEMPGKKSMERRVRETVVQERCLR